MSEARDKALAACDTAHSKCIGKTATTGIVGLALGFLGAVTAPTGVGLVIALLGGFAVGMDTTDKAIACGRSRDECQQKAPAE